MPSPVSDILLWANSEVDKLSGLALPAMTQALEAAEKELTRDLTKWLAMGKGADRFTPQMYRNALVQIRGTLNHLKNRFTKDTRDALKEASHTAGKYAVKHLIAEVEKFSSLFEGTIRPIALEAASVIAEGNKMLVPRFASSSARYAGDIGRDIRRQLTIGQIRGETLDQLTRRLGRLGGPKGWVFTRGVPGDPKAKAEYIAEGLFRRYSHWGERLARTEIVNAYNIQAREGIEDLNEHDPGYCLRWDAAIDGRTCSICGGLDDQIAEPGKGFPGGYMNPPAHPNCRCAVVAWRKEWHADEARYKDDLVAQSPRTRGGVADVPHMLMVPLQAYKPKK